MELEQKIAAVKPEDYISAQRQQELIELARQGYWASVVRLAIQETVVALTDKIVIGPTVWGRD